MANIPPPVAKATIKQAKADFKARGRPTMTDRELKQLDREAELGRRAWRSKEQDKRKTEAIKKRQEKERKEKAERERIMMGTQVRRDKFGYKSSQLHMGAFFGAGAGKKPEPVAVETTMEDDFEDDGVDDEALLGALQSPPTNVPQATLRQSQSFTPIQPPPPMATLQRAKTDPSPIDEEAFNSFWDDLDSSTQIARDLMDEKEEGPTTKHDECASSFSSGDFDICAEDLDKLIVSGKQVTEKESSARQLMPPPALPIRASPQAKPPAPSLGNPQQQTHKPNSDTNDSIHELGFSMSQLESFMDDDLRLSQMTPD